jgi:hypothetical protein
MLAIANISVCENERRNDEITIQNIVNKEIKKGIEGITKE